MRTNRLFFLILINLIPSFTFAQKGYTKGFLITQNQDTLHGKIKDNLFSMNSTHNTISFIDKDGQKSKFKAKEIQGYSKADIIDYVSIKDGSHRFAKVLVDGEIKLLSSTTESSGMHSDCNYTTTFTYKVKFYYLYNSSSKQITKVAPITFKNQVSDYISEYSALKEQVANKELRFDDLEIIIEKYNKWLIENK